MSIIGNIIWLIFGGFLAAVGYIVAGLALCLTIIGIPFGLRSIRLGIATLTPFGKEVVEEEGSEGLLAIIFTVVWVAAAGWEIAVAHLAAGALLAITIVGLPFAKQHFKLIPVALFPFRYTLR